MNRRQLLLGAMSAAALATSPLALAGVSPRVRRAMLGDAWRRAARLDKPLLVLVVPGEDDTYERGRRLGIWLNHASDSDLAPLANVQMACATLSELDKLLPGVAQADGAWMVLVRVDQSTPTWRSIVVPEPEQQSEYKELALQKKEAPNESLSALDLSDLRSARQRQRERRELDAHLNAFRASAGRVFRSEGLLPPATKTKAAAASARKRWVQQAPPGAHWAFSGSCGMHIQPNPGDVAAQQSTSFSCGMGRVTMYESRFLHLWDPNAWRG